MSAPYVFQKPEKNAARDDMLKVMQSGPVSKRALVKIGRLYGLYDGEITGIVGALAKNGDIKSPSAGWWALSNGGFTPESVGEVEMIAPETTRIGEVIIHRGVNYQRVIQVLN
jgi:hypothetical protein